MISIRTIAGTALAVGLLAMPAAAQVSTRAGIGAIPYNDGPGVTGVTFRTWAPNATSVAVGGIFNSWSATSHPMSSEGNGWWSRDVPLIQAGAQYKFAIKRGTTTYWKNDARARKLTSSIGNSVVYSPSSYAWQSSNFQMPAWTSVVAYEMHIGTFNVPTGAALPGTFATATAKLDHLQALGVNALELMPVNEFPGDISWGYNPSHPFSVESAYGGPDALKAFVDAAHQRGIAVMGDVVFNHFGPSDMDLWQYDGLSTSSTTGGIFFYEDANASTPWGPRPNYGRSEVRTYIKENTMMWLDEFRLDGLRFDGTKFMRLRDYAGPDIPDGWSMLQWCNDSADAQFPSKLMVAEDLGENAWITKTTGSGGAGFDSQWDGAFAYPVRTALEASNDSSRDMYAVRDAINKNFNGSMQQRVIYTENHDEVANGRTRVPEAIWPGNAASWYSRKRSTLGAVLVMTAPGIPMLFQGQEFLEDGYFAAEDPLDWTKATTYGKITDLYRSLIRLRRNLDGTSRGLSGAYTNVFHVNNSAKVLGFHRWQNGGPGDDVIVLTNFSNVAYPNYRVGLPRGGLWKVRFNSDSTAYSSDYGNYSATDVTADNSGYDGLPFSGNFRFGPYTSVIFSQSAPSQFDLNGDWTVGGADLGILLAQWGGPGTADFNGDGTVGGADIGMLLAVWGAVQ
ncbi:MAG: alpha-amylase family glycosyl hydrolase [Planctomycetota bacterium]|nr:alpha-amylase family glycosyl hydrolase [Planctomycetota bacterium]